MPKGKRARGDAIGELCNMSTKQKQVQYDRVFIRAERYREIVTYRDSIDVELSEFVLERFWCTPVRCLPESSGGGGSSSMALGPDSLYRHHATAFGVGFD